MEKTSTSKKPFGYRYRWRRDAEESVVAAVVAMLIVFVSGCGSSDDPGPRAGVHGEVTLDGKPLKAGAIAFHCGEGEQAVTAVGFVEHGKYRIEPREGPLVGTARVEFSPKPIDYEAFELAVEEVSRHGRRPRLTVVDIPSRYQRQSNLTAKVTLDGENRFDFHLRTRL